MQVLWRKIGIFIDIAEVVTAYYTRIPDGKTRPAGRWNIRAPRFLLDSAFNENHIHATTQAIVDYRTQQGINGPIFIGHAHPCAFRTCDGIFALEVLLANDVPVPNDDRGRYTLTSSAVSHAILAHNAKLPGGVTGTDPKRADGIVTLPSHNRPATAALNT